jgi:hypothetical protein
VSAGGEAEALDCCLQDFFAFGGNGAVFSDQLGRHLRIGINVFVAVVAFELDFAGADNAAADADKAFDFRVAAQFFVIHEGNFDVNVNAVQQRAGIFRDVALDLDPGAVAFALGVSEKPARAGVHSGGQHEARRKIHGECSAGDGDVAVFEWPSLSPLGDVHSRFSLMDLTVYRETLICGQIRASSVRLSCDKERSGTRALHRNPSGTSSKRLRNVPTSRISLRMTCAAPARDYVTWLAETLNRFSFCLVTHRFRRLSIIWDANRNCGMR